MRGIQDLACGVDIAITLVASLWNITVSIVPNRAGRAETD
jgi:hypothetical protein